MALGGGCSVEGHRRSGETPPQHPLHCTVAQAVPSQSLTVPLLPLHLLKSFLCLLTARLQSRLLQELPPRFLAASAACVRCKGEAEGVEV